MNDIMKTIGILQSVRDDLRIQHRPGMYGVDLSEEIQQLQQAITLLSPPADEPAGEPRQQPETPPPLSGQWQSCVDGIDADDGDWLLYAWHDKIGWQYAAAQVGRIELLDWDGNQVELEPSDFYMRIKP